MEVVTNLLTLILLLCTTTSLATTTPSTTTTTATTTVATAATTPTTSLDTLSNDNLLFCWCDLKPNQCDVNCCCDNDCTASDRLSFSACIDDYTPPDKRMCIQKSLLFTNNTPYTVDTSVPGLFCINTNNYHSANYYQAPSLVTSLSQFDNYRRLYPSYAYTSRTESTYDIATTGSQHYVSGDPVLTVYKTSDGSTLLGMLASPAPAATDMTCVNNNPTAYLYGETTSCVQPIPRDDLATECTANVMLQAATYYDQFKLIATPAVFNTSLNVPLYESKYAINIAATNTAQKTTPTWNNTVCHGVVSRVSYNLAYNGTGGIASATVTFTFRDIMPNDLPFMQTFTTNYYQYGTSSNVTQFSGNPGYLVRQPVRAGHLITNSDGVSAVELNSNRSHWMTMLSSSADGLCTSSVNSRVPVLFGVNMRSGCFISFTYNNMSSLCNESQHYAVNALLGNYPPSHIASFGNTAVENAAGWIPIYQNLTSSSCSLKYGPTSSVPGTCNNIITGMNIHIVYANVGAISNPQAQIIGAEYQFICQSELHFQCVGSYCHPSTMNTTAQRVEVVSSVTFVDASTPPSPGYAQVPTSSSALPPDFFYPLT